MTKDWCLYEATKISTLTEHLIPHKCVNIYNTHILNTISHFGWKVVDDHIRSVKLLIECNLNEQKLELVQTRSSNWSNVKWSSDVVPLTHSSLNGLGWGWLQWIGLSLLYWIWKVKMGKCIYMDALIGRIGMNTKNCCVLMLLIPYSLTFSDPFSLKVGDDAFPSPDIWFPMLPFILGLAFQASSLTSWASTCSDTCADTCSTSFSEMSSKWSSLSFNRKTWIENVFFRRFWPHLSLQPQK